MKYSGRQKPSRTPPVWDLEGREVLDSGTSHIVLLSNIINLLFRNYFGIILFLWILKDKYVPGFARVNKKEMWFLFSIYSLTFREALEVPASNQEAFLRCKKT